MRQILLAAVLVAGLATTANASHPTRICLDIGADQRYPVSNDDIVDSIWAYPGATDAGHPPVHEGCVTDQVEPGQDWGGTNVDFEITGVADPDSSDSPMTPDMTCTVSSGSGACTVYPPVSGGGTQTIRAWLDFDLNDATVEADIAEGYDEDTVPGNEAEPDSTDVTDLIWTHGDPPPPATATVSIRYRRATNVFKGAVQSPTIECEGSRTLNLWKIRRGDDRLVRHTTTDDAGRWWIGSIARPDGRYYARIDYAAAGPYGCSPANSETIRV